jgi:Flp pilus assembly pilin Flp
MLLKIKNRMGQVRLGERGASSVEYLIVVGLIAFAVYSAFQSFGTAVSGKVSEATAKVQSMNFSGGN